MIRELKMTRAIAGRITGKAKRAPFPRSVFFELTYRCNLACRHCYVCRDKSRKEMDAAMVKNVLDQLVEGGTLHLTFTGGEPLVRTDAFNLLEYARHKGLFIHLFTNAALITKEKAAKLANLGLTSLEISLHSVRPRCFDRFVRRQGAFQKVMGAIRHLHSRSVPLVFKSVIGRHNLGQEPEIQRFADGLGARVEFSTMILGAMDCLSRNVGIRLSPAGSLAHYRKMHGDDSLVEELRECGEKFGEKNPYECILKGKKTGFSIDPCGGIKPCLDFPYAVYDLKNGSISQALPHIRDHVRMLAENFNGKCRECDLRAYCSSCPVKAMREAGSMDACPAFFRTYARLLKDLNNTHGD